MNLNQNPNPNLNINQMEIVSNGNKISNSMIKSSKINKFFAKLIKLFNLSNEFDKICKSANLTASLILLIKYFLKENSIFGLNYGLLNLFIFREKTASLELSYQYYSTTHYLAQTQNQDINYQTYQSILFYTSENNIKGLKYKLNQQGQIYYFDLNNEIKINKNIYLNSKEIISSLSTSYIIELFSYKLTTKDLSDFIQKCMQDFIIKSINKEKLILKSQFKPKFEFNSNLKYFRYINFNQQQNQLIFEEYKFHSNKTFHNIFFRGKKIFCKKIKSFLNGESEYKKLGIPYKLGIILHGKAGTGKTSCIKAITNLTQRNIIEVNFSRIRFYKELKALFYDQIINNINIPFNKRIYVFEEFDCILNQIKERTLINSNPNLNPNSNPNPNPNLNSEIPISLDMLLNLIDGPIELEGPIFILTTNYIDQIDSALKRAGRFDIILEMPLADDKIIQKILKHFYSAELYISESNAILIKEYSSFENKLIWSPAKISQFALECISSKSYLDLFIKKLIDSYEKEFTH